MQICFLTKRKKENWQIYVTPCYKTCVPQVKIKNKKNTYKKTFIRKMENDCRINCVNKKERDSKVKTDSMF